MRRRARWSLRLFGGFELSVLSGGERVASLGTRERGLLAYLALSPKGGQPRRKLAQTLPRLGDLGFAYLYVGAPDRVLEFHEANVEAGYSLGANTSLLWQPSYAGLRKTDRFKALVRSAGLLDYWRAKGWPDFCRPQGADDFICN